MLDPSHLVSPRGHLLSLVNMRLLAQHGDLQAEALKKEGPKLMAGDWSKFGMYFYDIVEDSHTACSINWSNCREPFGTRKNTSYEVLFKT
eukprot:5762690-Amphidinium_carterae.1